MNLKPQMHEKLNVQECDSPCATAKAKAARGREASAEQGATVDAMKIKVDNIKIVRHKSVNRES